MVRKRNLCTLPIRNTLGCANAVEDFLCISTVMWYQPGCTPRIKVDQTIDSNIEIIRFFQHQTVGHEIFKINFALTSRAHLCYTFFRVHNVVGCRFAHRLHHLI